MNGFLISLPYAVKYPIHDMSNDGLKESGTIAVWNYSPIFPLGYDRLR